MLNDILVESRLKIYTFVHHIIRIGSVWNSIILSNYYEKDFLYWTFSLQSYKTVVIIAVVVSLRVLEKMATKHWNWKKTCTFHERAQWKHLNFISIKFFRCRTDKKHFSNRASLCSWVNLNYYIIRFQVYYYVTYTHDYFLKRSVCFTIHIEHVLMNNFFVGSRKFKTVQPEKG